MSTVNATSLVSDSISANTIRVGSNVVINSTAILVGNSISQTLVNSTAVSANLITLNGTTISTITVYGGNTNYQTFTTPGWTTWTKPAGTNANDIITIMLWGGGGGGYSSASPNLAGAGGGGSCVIVNKLAGECNAICNVFVGSAGLGGNSSSASTFGGNSVFWSNSSFSISAYGGQSGLSAGGAGAGWFASGASSIGGSPLGGAAGATGGDSTFGGGGGGTSAGGNGGDSVYGGGGGAAASSGRGGNSIYGGGGGTFSGVSGNSIFAGRGGNSSVSALSPAGGGATLGVSNPTNITAMNGGRGEVRVWVTKVT